MTDGKATVVTKLEQQKLALQIGLAALIALVCAWLAFSPALFNDGDTSWHIATGRLILDTGSVPVSDPFSFTFGGQPWTAHEWLADVLMASIFAMGSWSLLSLLFAASVGLTLFLIGGWLLRFVAPRYVALLLAIAVAMLSPSMLARPHVLAWPLFTAWMMIVLQARQLHRAPPLGAAAIMLVWANLHASHVIGLGLAGLLALEALVEEPDRGTVFRQWGLFGVASLAAALITPHGWHALIYPLQVSGMDNLAVIDEWRATSLRKDPFFVLFAAGAAGISLWRWRRLKFVRILILLTLGIMAFRHYRHQQLFALTALLLLAPLVGDERDDAPAPGSLFKFASIALLAIALVRLAFPWHRGNDVNYPATAMAKVPATLRSQPVLNGYNFGGPLIQAGIKPFIDGRSDMYGDAFVLGHYAMTSGDIALFRQAASRWKLRWTIFSPDTPLVAQLDREPGWRRLYADRWAVIHVRETPQPVAVTRRPTEPGPLTPVHRSALPDR